MSVNKVNKTTGDLSLLAGANNITNTTGVAELSALANLGTAANATQHEVNVAIDGLHQYDDNSYVEIAGVSPASQVNRVSLLAKRKGSVVTLRGYFEINLTGSTHNTLELFPAGSIPAKYRPSSSSVVTSLGYRDNETTYMLGRFIVDTDGSISLGEYYTAGNEQDITIFNFTMTYVV